MIWRARYFLIGGIALIVAGNLIGWHFRVDPGEGLKPDGGPVVTVMDFSTSARAKATITRRGSSFGSSRIGARSAPWK
jgi:hypothetical protein